MLHVSVAVASGRSETFSLPQSSKVGDLRLLAQKSFQLGFLKLVDAKYRVLHPEEFLQAVALEEGDHLTAIAREAKVAATAHRIALFCYEGDQVVTWGYQHQARRFLKSWSSYRCPVPDQLKGVQQVQATQDAFAAILADGSVVTWGTEESGGDSSAVKNQLKGVKQIQATTRAFAAILADGSVVTWGTEESGGDSSAIKNQLKGVKEIQATTRAFAAILADGSVVTWGSRFDGGDSSRVQDQLKGVHQIQATSAAFVAILADGSVATWGSPAHGGDSSAVADHLAFV